MIRPAARKAITSVVMLGSLRTVPANPRIVRK